MKAIVYVHGKGGNAAESEHYKPLFPEFEVIGAEYQTNTPWEAGEEIRLAVEDVKKRHEKIVLIANSVGAFFSMYAGLDISEAFFISPIVDMEGLIEGLMRQEKVTEEELRTKGTIPTAFGEDLSWTYLSFVRTHPIEWEVPTHILYGEKDELTSYETIRSFAQKHNADLSVMKNGEHWFHTDEQLKFLDEWLKRIKGER